MTFLMAALLHMMAQAGIIHGIVIEHATSRPLARTLVQLQTIVDGSPRAVATAMANRSGQYYFPSLPDGEYLLVASRPGYYEARFGQRRPTGPGAVILVTGEAVTFAELRMRKFGAISGRIVDENRVAIQGTSVIAYPARLPLSQATTAKTDDRGVYRLFGLLPGDYWIRSTATLFDDGSGILPTYYTSTTETRDAQMIHVDLESDIPEIDIQPLPGKLFKLTGKITCSPGIPGVKVTLSSDAGRKDAMANCPIATYSFDGLAPTNYEVLVVPMGSPAPYAAYREIFLDRDGDVSLQMTEMPRVEWSLTATDRTNLNRNEAVVTGQRRDLAGAAAAEPLGGHMLPGYYEIYFNPRSALYFDRVRTSPDRKRTIPFKGEVNAPVIHMEQSFHVTVSVVASKRVASISGTVKREGQVVANAPVYLYAMDPEVRQRVHGVRSVRSAMKGDYSFGNLPPGRYQVISTYDLDDINSITLEHAHAADVTLEDGKAATVELELYQLR